MQLALADRLKAFGIHLGISAVILGVALYLIAIVWYPAPYFSIAGGWQGVRIMILVDMVLGPLLTLLIFDRSKGWKKLRFDLWCIGLAQVSALLWGFSAVSSQKPVASVFWKGEFNIVTAGDYDEQDVGPEALDRFGKERPQHLYAVEPRDNDEAAGMMAYEMMAGLGAWSLDFLHEPLAEHLDKVFSKSADLRTHLRQYPAAVAAWDRLRVKQGEEAELLKFYTVRARYGTALLAIDPKGNVVGALPGEDYDGDWFALPAFFIK